jgi:hypothetical protein
MFMKQGREGTTKEAIRMDVLRLTLIMLACWLATLLVRKPPPAPHRSG